MWIFGMGVKCVRNGSVVIKKLYLNMHHYYGKQYCTLYIHRTLAMDIVTWVGLMCVKLKQDC